MTTNYIIKQANDYERVSMCWHEAAHTICGLYNYMRVFNVYVMSDKHENGNTQYEIYDPANINNKILTKILIIYEVQTLYAGLVGEKIYYKDICGSDDFPMHLRIGSSNDIREAAKLISKYNLCLPGKERYVFKKQIQNDTAKILRNYWDDIKLISHMLYKHKELDYDDLKFGLTRKSKNRDFWKNRFKEIKNIYSSQNELDEKYLKDVLLRNNIIVM